MLLCVLEEALLAVDAHRQKLPVETVVLYSLIGPTNNAVEVGAQFGRFLVFPQHLTLHKFLFEYVHNPALTLVVAQVLIGWSFGLGL